MLKTTRIGLCAAGVFVFSTVFAPSSHAQLPFTDGEWQGVETYTDTEYVNDQLVSETTTTVWATLTIQIDPSFEGPIYQPEYDMATLSMFDTNIDGLVGLSPYGPDGNGLSGFIEETIYHAEYGFAYFDAIPGSYADATFSGSYGGVDGTFSLVMASFQTVPEPSAFAEAALAIVSLSVFWCVRRLLARWSVASAATEVNLV